MEVGIGPDILGSRLARHRRFVVRAVPLSKSLLGFPMCLGHPGLVIESFGFLYQLWSGGYWFVRIVLAGCEAVALVGGATDVSRRVLEALRVPWSWSGRFHSFYRGFADCGLVSKSGMTLGLRILAAANCYKETLRRAYASWKEVVVELDVQIAAIARGTSGCAVNQCWVSGGELRKLLRARSLSQALLAAFSEGIGALDTEALVRAQEKIERLILGLVRIVGS